MNRNLREINNRCLNLSKRRARDLTISIVKRCILRERSEAADKLFHETSKTVLDVHHFQGEVSAACWQTERTFSENLQPRVDFEEMAEYQKIQRVHQETREQTAIAKRARRKDLEQRLNSKKDKDHEMPEIRDPSKDHKHSPSQSRAFETGPSAAVHKSRDNTRSSRIETFADVQQQEAPSLPKLLQKHGRVVGLEAFYEYKERLTDTKKLQREVDNMTVALLNKSQSKKQYQILDDVQGMITKQVELIESDAVRREKQEQKFKRAQSAAAPVISDRLFRTQLDARGVSAFTYNPAGRKYTDVDIEISSPLLKQNHPKREELKNMLNLPLAVIESRADTQAVTAWRKTIRSLKRKKPKIRKRLDPSLSILA